MRSGVTGSIVSEKPFYSETYDDKKPGDLVMAMVGKIDLLVLKQGLVGRNYLFFSVMSNFTYLDCDTVMGDDECDERIKIAMITVVGRRGNDWDMTSLPVWVNVVVKKRHGGLYGVNICLRNELRYHFYIPSVTAGYHTSDWFHCQIG